MNIASKNNRELQLKKYYQLMAKLNHVATGTGPEIIQGGSQLVGLGFNFVFQVGTGKFWSSKTMSNGLI